MRKQRAFASLTEDEINQIAEWLQQDTYDRVRERVAKPRPEGFGLQVKSRRPFETLFANKNRIDKINRKLETGQKLTLAEFESIAAGEKADLPEQIHNAILETTYERVLEDDNTPTQLLALQRLADFPARADYREHKIQMDLHRQEMAEHRKHIANERLALSNRLATIRDVCRADGIVLDPVYTGKAFHGMVTELAADPRRFGAAVAFLHTGGLFGLFAASDITQVL